MSDTTFVAGFVEASRFLVAVTGTVPRDRWDGPGLGEWSLRELAAHADRGQTTVVEYLLHPREPEPPDSDYFTEENVAARAREAVAALGDDPAAAIDASSRRAVELLERTPSDAVVGGPAGTMPLALYLPSRTAELTIHGLDIARALGVEVTPPPRALRESLLFVAHRASSRSGEEVLLALTGRGRLPDGYSAY